MQLSFYSVADLYYHRFVCPYILTAMMTNPGAYAEILIRDYNKFLISHGQLTDALLKEFGSNVLIRCVDDYEKTIRTEKLRYIVQPILRSDYYYITDIDFVFTSESESMIAHAEAEIKRCGSCCTPYQRPSNSDVGRVSGVLFVNNNYFTGLNGIDKEWMKDKIHGYTTDEEFLKKLIKKIEPGIKMDSVENRKLKAYHISLNRRPFGAYELFFPDDFKKLEAMTETETWKKYFPRFGSSFCDIFNAYMEYGHKEMANVGN